MLDQQQPRFVDTSSFLLREDFAQVFQRDGTTAADLLTHLTLKFNRLLEALRSEEAQRKAAEQLAAELQAKISQYHDFDQVLATHDALIEAEALRGRLTALETELSLCLCEKTKL